MADYKPWQYRDVIEAWHAGVDYDDLHIYYSAPMSDCECDACERGRLWERTENQLYEDCAPFWEWTRAKYGC